MKILVTGSAGHLGEALVRTLRAQGKNVLGLDRKPSAFTDLVGSITDRSFVKKSLLNVGAVIHSATLHKPHVATHSNQDFVDTNISGTLNLLEEAAAAGVNAFIFTSTTSTFGAAMNPSLNEPAAWITEEVKPIPKNIYGVTKVAAEDICELFARKKGLPVIVLKTSRFFPEEDDDPTVRDIYSMENVQALELLYRRVDIEDAVNAHLLAIEKAAQIGFGKYIISATTPFEKEHLPRLRTNAAEIIQEIFPECIDRFASVNWKIFTEMDRVYVNQLALDELGWKPRYDFKYVLECLRNGEDFRSLLAREVGSKGYHDENLRYPFA